MAVKPTVKKTTQRTVKPKLAGKASVAKKAAGKPKLAVAVTPSRKTIGKARAAQPKKKPPVKLSAEMITFRQQLVEEQARLEAELEEIESRTSRLDETERASEMSHYDDLPADLASETFEREKDLAIGESVHHLLLRVMSAIEKVDRGTYGLCDGCSKPIKKARLKAMPFATMCLDCQGRYES